MIESYRKCHKGKAKVFPFAFINKIIKYGSFSFTVFQGKPTYKYFCYISDHFVTFIKILNIYLAI